MPLNTLTEVFHLLSGFLPDSFISSTSWQQAIILAKHLPALICPYSFGFETPVNLPLTNIDLAFCITQPGCDMLAGTYPVKSKSELLNNLQIWSNIKNFCKVWGNPASGLFHRVENLWLEFRLQSEDAYLFPVPFIKIKDNIDQETWMPEALELLYSERIPDQVKRNLSELLKSLNPQLRPFQTGIYKRDGECWVRLCLEGLTIKELPGFLNSIDLDESYLFDDDVLSVVERICVHIDVGKSIGPVVGIELRQSPEQELVLQAQPEWDRLLDLLEQKKLCLSENKEFLKGFRGSSYEMIYPDLTQFLTFRFLYYLKVVYTPGKPIKVKAYFGFVNRTFVPPLEKIEKPSLILHKHLTQEIISKAIQRGVTFLAQNQLPNGEFKTYIARDKELESAEFDSSPFVTAFVLYCTRHLPAEVFDMPRQRAKLFLLKEGSPGYIWKYWTHLSNKTIVPDLDDTCCISFIMQELFQLDEVKQNIPAILLNRNENGLFKTWINEKQAPNDVDIVVNANVLLYLGEREETKATVAFIRECIIKGDEQSHYWYYLNNLACYYMITRVIQHGIHAFDDLFPVIKKRILESRNPEGIWGDELTTALALCALQNMGIREKEIENAKLWLINRQQANGCWKRAAFYTGPKPLAPHSVWFGSEELITAFCIEALSGGSYLN